MANKIHQWLDAAYLLCIWISGLSILLMSLIIPWSIFARYVLGSGSNWPEPVAVLLMVMFTFFGAAATYRAGGHIAVNMFTDRLPSSWQWLCSKVVDVLMAMACLFVIIWGGKLSIDMMRQGIAELPWIPVGCTYLPLPIGSFFTLLFVIERAVFGSQTARAVVTIDHQPLPT